jgi:nickel transport protein
MTKAIVSLVFLLVASATWNAPGFGHGVTHQVFDGALGLEASYDDGTPMRYCEVEVFSPLDEETPFQQGFTDANGRFAFVPDAPGTWRVTVDDGMGHALNERIEVEESLAVRKRDHFRFTRVQGAIVGVSLILAIFGLVSFLAQRRRRESRG